VNYGDFFAELVKSGAPWWAAAAIIILLVVIFRWKTFSDCWLEHKKFSHKRDIDIRKIEASARNASEGATGKKKT